MKFKVLLVITAIFFIINALIALLIPATQLSLYDVTTGAGEKYMGQWAGLGSMAVALLAWFSRNISDYEASRAIYLTLLIYFIVGLIISITGTISGVMSAMGWSLVIIYLLFATAYAYFLLRHPKSS
jgi:ABC-type uncharacterized transport system involved in gliding motility auxiliary subunit